jgi:hypothetical protein
MKTRVIFGISASTMCALFATSVLAGVGSSPNPTGQRIGPHVVVSILCPANLRVPILTEFAPEWNPKNYPWQLTGTAGAKLSLFGAHIWHGSGDDSLACGYGGPAGPTIYISHAKGCAVNSAKNGFDC